MRSTVGVLGTIRLYLEATRIIEATMMLGVPAWSLLFLLPDLGEANLGRSAFVLIAIYPLTFT